MLKKYLFVTVLCTSLVSSSLFAAEGSVNSLKMEACLQKVRELQSGHNYVFNYSFTRSKPGYDPIYQFLINSKKFDNIEACLSDLTNTLHEDAIWGDKQTKNFFVNVYKNHFSLVSFITHKMNLEK